MLYRRWNLREQDPEKAAVLAKATGAGQLLCSVLVARGIDTPEAVAALLAEGDSLPDPLTIRDMDRAVARIHTALENEEAIAVFGDYDVDGITSTALMYTYLESLGAEVYYKLPSRNDDDYGLSPTVVDQVADHGITLIITVDNGTTAFEAAERARERGVGLVVTDHHLPYDTLPEVDALVNPCRTDDDSGLEQLSGVGVAFMLLAALEGCPPEELLEVFGDLVAVGTVADVMKLTGHNRTIVRAGLAVMQDTRRPGLAALIRACGLGDKAITAQNISYALAPRLNAAGRMDDATSALQLLLAESDEEALPIVQGLQDQNAARQKAEGEILEVVTREIQDDPELQRSRVLIIAGDDWHQGVIGIVASRLVDRYAKPAIVIAFEGDEGKGSGRSIAGFSLHGAIASCEDILIRYGGHDLAAGFSIHRDYVEQFRRRVNKWAMDNVPVPSLPEVWADTTVQLDELNVEQVRQLGRMAPCGSGNPVPRFLVQNAMVEAVYAVSEGRHCRLRLRQGNGCLYAVLFGIGPDKLAYRAGDMVDVLLGLSLFEGRQGEQVSANIIEVRPAGMGEDHVVQSALFESFYAGWQPQTESQSVLLAPSRDNTVAVYRYLKNGHGAVRCSDLRPLLSRLGEDSTGRLLTSLAALEELGLIERDKETGCFRVVEVSQKRDLADSLMLQRLGVM